MTNAPDGNLHVYMLSVGQGDTTVTVWPKGKITIIDATRPHKLLTLLSDLGFDGTIEYLVITHPHSDHFSGGNRLAQETTIMQAAVAPFWHDFGMGPPTYRRMLGRLEDQGTSVSFTSGYGRWYPDDAPRAPEGGGDPVIDPDAPFIELLGPTNGLVRQLEDANVFNTNHLTIMGRLAWKNFRMVITGDAQMENWGFFDTERLMEGSCGVLRAAHHGSANGTQWERIDRLSPETIVVPSDPHSGHHLPGLTSTAIFAKYNTIPGKMAVISRDAGTIHLRITPTGSQSMRRFGEAPTQNADLNSPIPMTETSNPTDWVSLLNDRVADL